MRKKSETSRDSVLLCARELGMLSQTLPRQSRHSRHHLQPPTPHETRENQVGTLQAIQKSNSLSNLRGGPIIQGKTKKFSSPAQEPKETRSRPHAGIRRSSSLRNILAHTDLSLPPSRPALHVAPPTIPTNNFRPQRKLPHSSCMSQSLLVSSSPPSLVDSGRGSSCSSSLSLDSLDDDLVLTWLRQVGHAEYYTLFHRAGYDLATITRMTPEDLTAIGIQNPGHRKRLKAEISKLHIGDGLPNHIPGSLEEWLHLVRLQDYLGVLRQQGYTTLNQVATINIEDLEDTGFYKLGHQKRLTLALRKLNTMLKGQKLHHLNSRNTLKRDQFSTFHAPISSAMWHGEGHADWTQAVERPHLVYRSDTRQNTPSPPLPPYPSTTLPPKMKPLSSSSYGLPPKPRPIAMIKGQQHQRKSSGRFPSFGCPVDNSPTSATTPKACSSRPRNTRDTSPAGRNTGDVLQDIGSMLSDLTKELDSMIQLEPHK